MSIDSKRTIITKAHRLLQAKVGVGLIDEDLVKKSQKLIDEIQVDFAPMAKEYLDMLRVSISEARKGNKGDSVLLQEMTESIMQIKANASMFDYPLAGKLADIMLNFLETIESIDEDVIEIVDAHYKTLILIIGNEIKGDGGEYGEELTKELKNACRRYFAQEAGKGIIIEDKDAFFIDG